MGPIDRAEDNTEFARFLTFSDGIFAIAITLLVLNIEVPRLAPGQSLGAPLLAQWPDLLAYAVSFAVIGRFWLVHHRLFAAIDRVDSALIALNLASLACIGLVPFTTQLLDTYPNDASAPIAYAAVLSLAGLLHWLMTRHALRRDFVRADRRASTEAFGEHRALVVPAAFLVSIPIAVASPPAAELTWAVVLLGRVVVGRVEARSSRAPRPAPPPRGEEHPEPSAAASGQGTTRG